MSGRKRAGGGRRRIAGAIGAILLATAATAAPRPARADSFPGGPREFLPTEHWAYRDFERLWARGLLDKVDMAARPWGRDEAARLLVGSLAQPGAPAHDPVVERLVHEFTEELHRLDPARFPAGPSPVGRVRDGDTELQWTVGAKVGTTEDEPGMLQLAPESRADVQIRAYLSRDLFAMSEVRAQRTGSGRNIGDSLVKNEDIYLDAGETYISFSPTTVQATAGYLRHRWGPGATGTLLLSDAAPPFASVRWERRFGGVLAFHALSGVLADPDHRYLAAHRLTWTPSPSLAVGIAEAARYDARSLEFLYLLNLVPYTIVERISAKTRVEAPEIASRNNVMMSADVAWRPRAGTRLTAEFLLDDLATESAGMPHRLAYQVGAEQWLSAFARPVGLSAEFTKVFRYTYATFYERDFVHGGRPLGYALGPDVENLAVELRVEAAADWAAWIGAQFVRRGEAALGDAWLPGTPSSPWDAATLSGTVEAETALRVGVEAHPRPYAAADLVVGYHHRANADHVDGAGRDSFEVRASVAVRK